MMGGALTARVFCPIPGWGGRYSASSDGLIFSLKTGRPLHQELNPRTGRLQVKLWRGRKASTTPVHSLICRAFHGPRPAGKDASHLNGDQTNNRAINLAWETHQENLARRIEHGTDDGGHRNSRAALTASQLAEVRSLIAAGVPYAEIGSRFGVSKPTISRIKTGKRYARC